MSMFIVSNDCLNDVANLIHKIFPYMDLNDIFKRLLSLNISVWNNKYNQEDNLLDYLKTYEIKDYSEYVYKDKTNIIQFKKEYENTNILQLVESLDCYWYQIEENYIDNILDRFTYSMVRELVENPLIVEIRNFIKFHRLEDDKKIIDMVEWNKR